MTQYPDTLFIDGTYGLNGKVISKVFSNADPKTIDPHHYFDQLRILFEDGSECLIRVDKGGKLNMITIN